MTTVAQTTGYDARFLDCPAEYRTVLENVQRTNERANGNPLKRVLIACYARGVGEVGELVRVNSECMYLVTGNGQPWEIKWANHPRLSIIPYMEVLARCNGHY